jgi:NAD(P)H-hydrate epimerase
VVGKFPELMTEFLPETEKGSFAKAGAEIVIPQLEQADVLVLGPGLTTHPSTRKLTWELVRRSPVPVVLDADAINAYVPPAEPLQNEADQPVIITPHPGEMSRLIGKKISSVQKNRLETACGFAVKHHCYAILKGFQTVIATPAGDIFINNTGNPGMATGGTGDILAGMIGRFAASWRCRHIRGGATRAGRADLADYLSAAVYLHGAAGDLAAEKDSAESLIATDLLDHLPHAIKKVRSS